MLWNTHLHVMESGRLTLQERAAQAVMAAAVPQPPGADDDGGRSSRAPVDGKSSASHGWTKGGAALRTQAFPASGSARPQLSGPASAPASASPSLPKASPAKPTNAIHGTSAAGNVHTGTTARDDLRSGARKGGGPQTRMAVASRDPSASSVLHNTWITTTLTMSSGSAAFTPFYTFGGAPTTTAASSGAPRVAPTGGAGASGGTVAELGGASAASAGRVPLVAGVTAGAVVVVLLVLLSVFAYTRGGALRSLTSSEHAPPCESERKGPPASVSRRGTGAARPRDLESASVSSESEKRFDDQGKDGEDRWEEIDVRAPGNGHADMEKGDGEWVETWRRGKERMMASMRRVPALQFDPALPLPPISLEEGMRRQRR
ncbi:hypothetical protein DFH11DRAFT_760660 [Phellopilus nigrolimitatus]|nr:hypothetical protein DFH11DRAFT_760660 [Phellopilus nigrolimitatus]